MHHSRKGNQPCSYTTGGKKTLSTNKNVKEKQFFIIQIQDHAWVGKDGKVNTAILYNLNSQTLIHMATCG
jgi:hypothetical protein